MSSTCLVSGNQTHHSNFNKSSKDKSFAHFCIIAASNYYCKVLISK